MQEAKMTAEEAFRESLKDTLAIIDKLSAVTNDAGEIAQMLELAIANDAQLKLIIGLVKRK